MFRLDLKGMFVWYTFWSSFSPPPFLSQLHMLSVVNNNMLHGVKTTLMIRQDRQITQLTNSNDLLL